MKTGRRNEPDTLRRDVRERDISRFNNRKRPSMLSEFQGKHNYRDSERDGSDVSHFRSHNRYSYEGSSMLSSEHNCRPSSFNSSTVSGGLHSKIKPDPRSKRIYSPLTSQLNYRTQSNHYHHSSHSRIDNSVSESPFDEDFPMKRPRLSVDVNRRASLNVDPPNSADSITSSVHTSCGLDTPNDIGSPAVSPHNNFKSGSGFSAFLEDIVSDDDDSLLQEDDTSSMKPAPLLKPSRLPLNTKTESVSSSSVKDCSESKPSNKDINVAAIQVKPSKEELLQMMEKVDRDISALELQIANLQKKQAELKEGAKTTPPSHVPVSTPSPTTPSPDMDNQIREETPPTSPIPFSEQQTSLKRTLAETIYSENRAKAKSAHSLLQSLNFHPLPLHGIVPLYLQPSEAPHYHDNILSYRQFKPQLVELLKRRKISRHRKELSLCETYDSLMADWDRRVDRIESTSKKRARDLKNRELFERAFPELKARREQLERFTRVDQRGFSVLRSDAELKELMFELYNKEEAPARYRKTHAIIPPMLIDERDQRVMFHSTNGHISDVMAVHKDLKFSNIWIDEEKAIFREKFMLYPKNFDMISTFLPYKSPSDCVKYYYLSKKNENFKQLVRKANLKRKKALIKPPELSLSASSLTATPISTSTLSLSMMGKDKLKSDQFSVTEIDQSVDGVRDIKPELGDWTDDNISNLKEGLRKYGRAWGKVYREVGGSKTATQCKMFYDDFCDNEMLGLLDALKEHSLMKNAEKLQRKNQTRKVAVDSRKKVLQQGDLTSPRSVDPTNVDSENTESVSGSDSNAEESESEGMITDSGLDKVMNEPVKHTPVGPQSKQLRVRSGTSKKSSLSTLASPSSITSGASKTSEDVVDLFLTAAEALKNNISPEVALHDHSYALPPSQLVNNMELQGTSGLSLIAAAAAVVSPNLSRNVGSGKHPVISPVRAPRGRPPNKYRGGGNNSTSKLAPTLLSPAGSSANVLLTDIKTAAFRNRTRSAPTDRPKSSTLHIPRTGSTLARMSLNNSTGRSGSKGVNLSASSSKPKYDSSSSPSLKSMIALHPQQATGNTSAFEALVNVAVAAPPVELPKSSSSAVAAHSTTGLVGRSSGPKKTAASSRGSGSTGTHSTKVVLSRSNSSDSSALSNGSSVTTATAYIDVSQAINILASLAQQTPGSSVGTSHAISVFQAQPLFAQTQALSASNLLESIVSHSNPKKSNSSPYTSSSVTSSTSSLSVTSNPASVSATVDTLLSHLTSGVNKGSSPSGRSSSSPKPVGRPRKVNKTEVTSTSSKSSGTTPSVTAASSQQTSDELSNLKLLSSLVAAVAATPSSMTTPQTQVSPHTSTSALSVQVNEGLTPDNSSDFSETSVKSSLDFPKSTSDTSPSTDTADYGFSSNKSTPPSISSTNGSLLTSVSNSTVSNFPTHSELPSPDELPRSVVRPNLSAFPSDSSSQRSLHLGTHLHSNSTCNSYEEPMILSDSNANASLLNSFPLGSTASDMTASLASIIPSYNPSVVQQSTLLLYTRSRSFPISSSSETCPDEEDHLESATRGISELSKLLGRDGNGGGVEKDSSKKMNETSLDNSNESISANTTNGVPMSSLARAILTDFNTTTSDTTSPPLEHNLSSLLESRETVLNSSLSGGSSSRSIVDLSPITYTDGLNSDTPLNIDSQLN